MNRPLRAFIGSRGICEARAMRWLRRCRLVVVAKAGVVDVEAAVAPVPLPEVAVAVAARAAVVVKVALVAERAAVVGRSIRNSLRREAAVVGAAAADRS